MRFTTVLYYGACFRSALMLHVFLIYRAHAKGGRREGRGGQSLTHWVEEYIFVLAL